MTTPNTPSNPTSSRAGAPLALVTGASSGIGFELARQFTAHGFDLVVNAEDAELDAATARLRTGGVEVDPVRADLRTRDGIEELLAGVAAVGRPLDAAALNAGVGLGGRFLDTDVGAEQAIIDLNITSTVHLSKRLLREMVGRGRGRLLITSSIASSMPGTYQAVYNASKSFVQSFSQAVQQELRGSPVTVTALMPGPTETEFFERARMDDTNVGQSSKDSAAQVAEQGFAAMMAGKDKVVSGSLQTKLSEVANSVLPDRVKAAAHALMAKPGSGR